MPFTLIKILKYSKTCLIRNLKDKKSSLKYEETL
jgi:hypothetical protein